MDRAAGAVLEFAGDGARREREDGGRRTRVRRSGRRANPRNGLYIYNRGLALQHLGRRDEAAAQFKRAAELGYPPRR